MLGVPTLGAEGIPSADSDVPLLGPMPPYAMQGSNQRGLQVNRNTTQSNAYFVDRPNPQHQETQQPQPQVDFSTLPNMDLNELLGGEEWAGAATVGGNFLPQLQQPAGSNAMPAATEDTIQFDDLSPGTLGWRPEGY